MGKPDRGPLRSLRTERFPLTDLILLTRNARSMTDEEYGRLVADIRVDGALTSVPFAVLIRSGRDKGRYLVRSGNNRVRAALEAGIDEADVMLCDDPLTEQRALAIQLAHNAIVGSDDPVVLRDMYASIEDIDWREYTGLDAATLDLAAPDDLIPVDEPDTADYSTVTLVFLPEDADRVAAAFDEVCAVVPPGAVWLASLADYDATLDALAAVGGAHAVRNQAVALRLLVDLAAAHYDDLTDAWWDTERDEPRRSNWVPLEAVLGGVHALPPDAANIVRSAIRAAVSSGDVSAEAPWRLLELMAADYLAGAR